MVSDVPLYLFILSLRLTGLEPLEDIAREFDRVKNPLEDWLLQQTEAFDALSPVEIAVEELTREKRELEGLGEEVKGRRGEVEKLEELASKFEMESEVWKHGNGVWNFGHIDEWE